jgi:hypothetical protein
VYRLPFGLSAYWAGRSALCLGGCSLAPPRVTSRFRPTLSRADSIAPPARFVLLAGPRQVSRQLPGLATSLGQKPGSCERGSGGAPRGDFTTPRLCHRRASFLGPGGAVGFGPSTPGLLVVELRGFCLVSSCFGLGVVVTAPAAPHLRLSNALSFPRGLQSPSGAATSLWRAQGSALPAPWAGCLAGSKDLEPFATIEL